MGIELSTTLDSLLLKAQAYIQYKEKEAANISRESRHQGSDKSSRSDEPLASRREGEKKREERSQDSKDYKGITGRFHDYNPLTTSRECILSECANSEFK